MDGLRGVAAIAVVIFHFFEAHNGYDVFRQKLNHGYLAVDFFFMLSGFVIGYAYDDRWGTMSVPGFFKRRLIRLQPLVVAGALFGAALYYLQASAVFSKIASMPVAGLLVATLAGALMIPLRPSAEIRGWGESYPLNGPTWSLLFEYIANILYATWLRRISVRTLVVLTILAGGVTVHYLLTESRADLIGGWELSSGHVRIGFTRLAFPFLAGLLLYRLGWLWRLRHGFWITSIALAAILCLPRLGTHAFMLPNAIYEAICVLVLFPIIVMAGAGAELPESRARSVCLFLGRLSYPVYILHYPIVYLYFTLLAKGHGGLLTASALFIVIIIFSYLMLRFYDEPLRARLSPKAKVRA